MTWSESCARALQRGNSCADRDILSQHLDNLLADALARQIPRLNLVLLVVAESCKDRGPALRAQIVAPEAASNRRAIVIGLESCVSWYPNASTSESKHLRKQALQKASVSESKRFRKQALQESKHCAASTSKRALRKLACRKAFLHISASVGLDDVDTPQCVLGQVGAGQQAAHLTLCSVALTLRVLLIATEP